MDAGSLLVLVAAYLASIVFPLVLLPWFLDRRGDLPYNSVRSRLLAWTVFAALLSTVTTLAPPGRSLWESGAMTGLLGLVAIAAAIDIWDLRRRRIPRARHPGT